MSASAKHENRLCSESSPYLLQHAGNPVDWYPWGDDALELARDSGKPILLSVGYSACHWCHVMAHESFEDEETASLMNELFVNIKVDREERPDIDRIYQTAHQLLTQRPGGWPLTVFINPEDQRPFFAGTYFPKQARYGMPAFSDLLQRVAAYFAENRDEVVDQGRQLELGLGRLEPEAVAGDHELTAEPITAARQRIADGFDRDFGGIGTAPKFPHPENLDRLLRHWRAGAGGPEPDVDALHMVSLTLTRMAEGGIYDQLGGGFCRYSVDRCWQIPHFEKMLYDNGPLLALYAQAFLATGDALFARIAGETADWMISDMQSPEGGFYAARDADSEGEEGRYYVWTPEQAGSLLDRETYDLLATRFGLDADANFEGRWHLTVRHRIDTIAEAAGLRQSDVEEKIDDARKILLDARGQRVAPGRDDKQLTSWNALAIRGLAIAGMVLDRPGLIDAAARAADFIERELVRDGRLMASYKDGESRFAAYLDDHVFMLDALLYLLQARWSGRHLELAIRLADLTLEHFQDRDKGGFYFTADDHETLMHRPKPLPDEAMPSGNGIAAYSLQRLGYLLARPRYLEAAEGTLRSAWRAMSEYPHGHVSLITALEEYLSPPEIIIIRGDEAQASRWRGTAANTYAPRRLIFAIDRDAEDLPAALMEKRAIENGITAYRCVGSRCSPPIKSVNELVVELAGAK
ncbi:MAG: thioredoxin domain-containing protein [Woeseia sp.]